MAWGVVLRGFLPLCLRRLACLTTNTYMGARIRPVRTDLTVPCRYPLWTTHPVRTLHLCPNLCAGHNKWSKVKNIKGPKDAARSRMFMKFGMMIRIAVKEGGSSNPEFNLALANVVEQCRGKNMPKVSIEAAIKGADLRHLLNKHGAALCDGVRHNFSRKGVVVTQGEGVSSERALELAIEAGAEDFQETEDEDEKPLLQFVCDMTELKKVRTSLEELGVRTVSAGLEFVSHTPTQLPQAQLEAALSLIEALSDCLDVVRVWDNIQAQS
ncbi:unnamed protein product [Coregonus sp. 'balchen']|nr:unnamed protein product [Coregonus sp. 'balchen']